MHSHHDEMKRACTLNQQFFALGICTVLGGGFIGCVDTSDVDDGATDYEARVQIESRILPPLTGGTVSPDALDAMTDPSLFMLDQEEEALAVEEYENVADESTKTFGQNKYGGVANASTGPQCATPGSENLPVGWTVTYGGWDTRCDSISGQFSICFLPNLYCFNEYEYTSYYDIPVGGTLRYCSRASVPAGWVVTQMNLAASCPGGGDNIMQHISCIAGRDTNCYPKTATISASPQTVQIPYGQLAASTTISWNTTNYASPCLWIKEDNASKFVRCSAGGAQTDVWTTGSLGQKIFWISDGTTMTSPNIAQVAVSWVASPAPTISASPQVVSIPAGQWQGSSSISYNLTGSGYTSACLWIRNTGEIEKLWACYSGLIKTQTWPHVPKGGTSTIWLAPGPNSSKPKLATVVVTGI